MLADLAWGLAVGLKFVPDLLKLALALGLALSLVVFGFLVVKALVIGRS